MAILQDVESLYNIYEREYGKVYRDNIKNISAKIDEIYDDAYDIRKLIYENVCEEINTKCFSATIEGVRYLTIKRKCLFFIRINDKFFQTFVDMVDKKVSMHFNKDQYTINTYKIDDNSIGVEFKFNNFANMQNYINEINKNKKEILLNIELLNKWKQECLEQQQIINIRNYIKS